MLRFKCAKCGKEIYSVNEFQHQYNVGAHKLSCDNKEVKK